MAILNWNGRHHLEYLLPSALIAAEKYPGTCSLVLLDNQSTEPDVEWVKKEFPMLEVVIAPKNDYLFSYNWLAEIRKEDVFVFLNNDLYLFPDFLTPLARHFSQKDVFAVMSTARDWEDTTFTGGPCRLRSHHGWYYWVYEVDRQELSHTLFCSGGHMAVDRLKFLELGGFNRLFWPAYCEDLDLGFRAWRRGWRSIFEPLSIVLHRENGSWGSDRDPKVGRMTLRAALFFQWSSLPCAASIPEQALYLFLTCVRKWKTGQKWWISAWFASWFKWWKIRHSYRSLKTSPEEARKICDEIDKPVSLLKS